MNITASYIISHAAISSNLYLALSFNYAMVLIDKNVICRQVILKKYVALYGVGPYYQMLGR